MTILIFIAVKFKNISSHYLYIQYTMTRKTFQFYMNYIWKRFSMGFYCLL